MTQLEHADPASFLAVADGEEQLTALSIGALPKYCHADEKFLEREIGLLISVQSSEDRQCQSLAHKWTHRGVQGRRRGTQGQQETRGEA